MKKEISKSVILESIVQISSIALSIYLIDVRGYPFLANRNFSNA